MGGRFLFSPIPGTDRAKVLLRKLLRDIPEQSELKVSLGLYRRGLAGWNHAKIIAIDGRLLIQGGHNWWDQHYLQESPVHDLSMEVTGEVAISAHRFLNHVWASL